MATALNNNELNSLIADHKTGQYSQRQLAVRYKISVGYVNKTIKDIDKIDEEAVNAGIAYKTALAQRDEHSVNAIEQVVNEKTKHLQFLHNATLKNISVMAKKLNEDATIQDHKQAQEAIHKAGQTLGVIDQFAKPGDVNVSSQNNVGIQTITRKIVD